MSWTTFFHIYIAIGFFIAFIGMPRGIQDIKERNPDMTILQIYIGSLMVVFVWPIGFVYMFKR